MQKRLFLGWGILLCFFLYAYTAEAQEMGGKGLKPVLAIGSTNKIKIEAVAEVVKSYPSFAQAELLSYRVDSKVSNQPLALAEVIEGAKNRAREAFAKCGRCHYSFGIESGLCEAPGTRSGYLETSICCVYDGNEYYTGLSLGTELPPQILKLILEEKMELEEAALRSGITRNTQLGASEGFIGLLTHGRINRLQSTKICVTTALVQLENREWYQKPYMDVVVGKGDLEGKGVYAARDFKKDEVVIQYHLKPLTQAQFEQLPEKEKIFTHTHWGVIQLYSEPERYVNHSDHPNTYQDLVRQCDVALRDIKKGEMITGDATKDDVG